MTTGWLLLVLVVVSSQSVDGQLTTDDEACDDGLLSEWKRDMQILLDNQLNLMNRLGKMYIEATHFTVLQLLKYLMIYLLIFTLYK